MNILNAIRRNWVWLLLCLMLLTISASHHLPAVKHPLSRWHICWIIIPIALSILADYKPWYILRPMRWWQWPMMKSVIEFKMSKLNDNALVYPALLWIEFHGQTAYVIGGMKAVQEGMFGTGDKVAKALTGFMEERVAEVNRQQQRKGCCGGNYPGCHCAEEEALPPIGDAVEKFRQSLPAQPGAEPDPA